MGQLINYTEEQKRYRNNFIMLTLLALFGILAGLFLYEYTDYFDTIKAEMLTPAKTGFNFEALVSLYYEEIKIPGLLFISGFTLFSPYISCAASVYKGFMTGFSTVFFGMQYQGSAISAKEFQIICATLILTLVIYIITAAKSMALGASLKYAAPDIASLLKQKFARQYILTFMLMAGFLMVTTVIRYTVSYI